MPDKFDVKDTGQREQFNTGSKRDTGDKERFDFISFIGMWRLSIHLAKGAKKYGDHNWEKGMPASQMINHAIRHIYLWLQGDDTEDHLSHSTFNLMAVVHFEETMESMVDVPTRKKSP